MMTFQGTELSAPGYMPLPQTLDHCFRIIIPQRQDGKVPDRLGPFIWLDVDVFVGVAESCPIMRKAAAGNPSEGSAICFDQGRGYQRQDLVHFVLSGDQRLTG